MRIFADTSGLFAAIVRNDVMHENAKQTMRVLLDLESELHVTSYVLLETLALLQSRVGLGAACKFEHRFRPLLRVTWMTDDLHGRAFQRLERKGSRALSLEDCASFVAMEDLGIDTVFGYDPHFAAEGFRLVGRPEEIAC